MPGPFDFTGQNIEDSYQRVLQTDGTLIYDGTGSLFTITPISASYATTASYVNPLVQNVIITGSLQATSFTGSLLGTASNALTASYLNELQVLPGNSLYLFYNY
jgi:hypothetical protein